MTDEIQTRTLPGTGLSRRVSDFIHDNDPFGDTFCRNDVKRIEDILKSCPAQSPDTRVREALPVGDVQEQFRVWWDGNQECPEHGMITQNAALAAWHAAYNKYVRALPQPGAVEPSCPGGIDPGWDECPKCGATMDDECGAAPKSPALHPATVEACIKAIGVYVASRDDLGRIHFVELSHAIRALLASGASNADPSTVPTWQPIETAPKDGTRFIAGVAGDDPTDVGIVSIVHRHDPGGAARNPKHHYECWVTDYNSPAGTEPTHWMPLPTPPSPVSQTSQTLDEQPVLEVWNGDRKVTVYEKEVMRIWGPDMEDQMCSDMRDHETVAAAFDWLYAEGPAALQDRVS